MIRLLNAQKVMILKPVNGGLGLKGIVKSEIPRFQDHLTISQAIVNKRKVMP